MVTQTKKPPPAVSNPWWGHDPSDKQLKALWVYEECPNLFYGGAAGPGKTSYLLMAAVQYVQYPHYRALILRKTYADLSLPGAIMDRAIDWWDGVEGARFSHADKKCYGPALAHSRPAASTRPYGAVEDGATRCRTCSGFREAWRLALFGVLSPLGRLVESELQEMS